MDLSVQNVLAVRARLGECPVWDGDRQRLYFVDVYNHRVHQFDPATGETRYFDTGEVVSAIALMGSDRLLISLRNRLAFLDTQTGDIAVQHTAEFPHPDDTRFNDGKCDARGRFWIGTCTDTKGQAALYRYDPDGSFQVMETGLTISNGLGWSPDGATFYLTDSAQHKIFAYDFVEETGEIGDRRVLVDLTDEAVEPDGLAIDVEGNLWSALWGGGCVACFDSTGKERLRVPLPAPCPTCPIFGGPSLSTLYVTSASVGFSQAEIQEYYTSGDLFAISTTTTGRKIYPFPT